MVDRTTETEMQFQNPDAPNYDWQKDREWFNQRLANARIRNSELEQEIARLRTIVRSVNRIITQNEPYKWKVERIVAALGETS